MGTFSAIVWQKFHWTEIYSQFFPYGTDHRHNAPQLNPVQSSATAANISGVLFLFS